MMRAKFSACIKQLFLLLVITLVTAGSICAQAQASTADLVGTVVDPSDAVVAGATVTAKNSATGVTRTVTANEAGEFRILALPPGTYSVTAEAKSFKKVVVSPITLTIGQSAEIKLKLEIGSEDVVVNVSGESLELVETTRSSVATTIEQQKIANLPVNQRDYLGFTLTTSTVGRDNGRPIGPAPTSGLNIGGQRGRSTLVQVDGADNTDNATNAPRSTVGQEAVQEFQITSNSYAAEFGRASGGVVNVVTKRGTNEFHGNIFGFLRDKELQARNALSPVEKPQYSRGQYGVTLGGPIIKDRTFFFVAFEGRQRNESGFFTTDVTQGLGSSVTLGPPYLPFTQTFNRLTPAQAAYAQALLGVSPATAVQYLYLASSGGNTALLGSNPLISAGGAIPAGQVVGSRFFLSGAPVPVGTTNSAGESIAFRPLLSLQKVFPIRDKTHYFSVRGDHNLNSQNQLSIRYSYNPSRVTGIQVESQNQSLGQNDFSRTGIADVKDTGFTVGLNSQIGGASANEFRFNYGKRKTTFVSQNNDAVAFNISGTAFIGRELFSPVDRQEIRYQFADNFNIVKGGHTFKFGGDYNKIKIPEARFELNFSGLFNFGPFAATNLAAFPTVGGIAPPAFTPVQAYGLGLPSIYIQGFGNPISKIKNTPVSFYGQDSWKIARNFTINYGVRYDTEFTQTIAPVGFRDPLSGITLSAGDIKAAQDAVGVQQGFPRDKNNWAPRLAFAWDVTNDQKTVVRGAFGLFYDHPLLAVAFNSDIADAAQQQQAVLTPGSPSPVALLNATQVFQGTVVVCNFPGANPGVNCTPGLASSAQYQSGRQRFNDQTFPGFGAVLPFVIPVAKDFQFAQAVQGNFAVERRINKDMSIAATYIFIGSHHLPRPTDLNTPNVALQIENYRRCFGTLPTNTTQVATVNPAACTAAGGWANVIPGMISVNLTTGQRVIAPAVANFFRPNAPNYFLAQALSGGAVTPAVLNSQLTGTVRTPGVISPFGSVNAQLSDGNSNYNALNVDLKRRMANNFLFTASYTWSHTIDDSSDLQTLLIAQDVNNFRAERADSLFDQRHRFVFSGIAMTPQSWRKGSGFQRVFSNLTLGTIVELSSGRPFNIITNVDSNNDQSTQTDRPNVNSSGVLSIAPDFTTGNLGRNSGITHSFADVTLRLTRAFHFSERVRVDVTAEGFNMFNRFNEGAVSPLFSDVNAFNQRAKNGKFYSRPTAAYDARQFQLGVKLNF